MGGLSCKLRTAGQLEEAASAAGRELKTMSMFFELLLIFDMMQQLFMALMQFAGGRKDGGSCCSSCQGAAGDCGG